MNIKITRHKQRLDNLFNDAALITDMRLQGEWARYLCVLSSGHLENSIRLILEDYISHNSSLKIQSFTETSIASITNCKIAKIKSIIEKFDTNWGIDFIDQINIKSTIPDEIKDSIDTLVQTRHDIAHGKNTGVGYTTIKRYFDKANIVVNIVNTIVV